jgi:histidinol-phosphate/aromatic aminotransferase/cobyric acid decarboxylase-like protein
VGYGLASHPELVNLLNRVRTPFNINRSAQAAAVVALGISNMLMTALRWSVRSAT